MTQRELSGDEAKIYGEYIGKYVILFPAQGSSYSGKLVNIEKGHAILNPHQGAEFSKTKGLTRKLIPKNAKVRLEYIITIEPTTKEDLEAYCEFQNEQDVLELKKRKSKPKDN